MILSLVTSIPPPTVDCLPSNVRVLCLSSNCASNIAPEELPPVIVTEDTFLTSKSCGSIKTSVSLPFTTGWTRAVVNPVLIVTDGRFMTSKFVPPLYTLTLSNGP